MSDPKSLIDKIKALPPDHLGEVEAFVDFIVLRGHNHALTRAAGEVSTTALAEVWNNPEDDAYDAI